MFENKIDIAIIYIKLYFNRRAIKALLLNPANIFSA